MSNLIWSYGDTKLDRYGRTIYFIEYTIQTDRKGNQIELWEPEDIFLARSTHDLARSPNYLKSVKYFLSILYYCCVYLFGAYIFLSVMGHFFSSMSDDGLLKTLKDIWDSLGSGAGR
jgi:hypothetical protein